VDARRREIGQFLRLGTLQPFKRASVRGLGETLHDALGIISPNALMSRRRQGRAHPDEVVLRPASCGGSSNIWSANSGGTAPGSRPHRQPVEDRLREVGEDNRGRFFA